MADRARRGGMIARERALVLTGPGKATVEPLAVEPPAPGEVQVRTTISALSTGTERWVLADRFTWEPTPFPCVPGYQRAGTVTAVGDAVERIAVGDPVVAAASVLRGPIRARWGAHAALANSPAHDVLPRASSVSELDGSAVVIAQVGYNAASRLTVARGSWVLVYGDGLIGQFAAQAARHLGFRTVLVGRHRERLELAARHSADVVLSNRTPPQPDAVREITGGRLADAVLDTVQTTAAETEYLALTGRAPEIVYCGFTPAPAWADMGRLQQVEATAQFVSGWTRDRLEQTLQLMAVGALRFTPLVTACEPASRSTALYDLLQGPSDRFLGLVIDWTAGEGRLVGGSWR